MSFYMSMVLAPVVSGLIWGWMYHPRGGLINNVLVGLGLVERGPGWLSDRDLALWSIIIVAIWRQVGYVMVLYLAGLKSINPEFLEAAKIDGANDWKVFSKVILPLLMPVTVIVLVISVIDFECLSAGPSQFPWEPGNLPHLCGRNAAAFPGIDAAGV